MWRWRLPWRRVAPGSSSRPAAPSRSRSRRRAPRCMPTASPSQLPRGSPRDWRGGLARLPGRASGCMVRPGDTLALIAERELGDADLAELLFLLNPGRLMPDGRRLERPDLVRPGWVLELPEPDLLPPPSTMAPPTAPPATTSAPPTSSPVVAAPQSRRPRVSVELPSGSVVAFSLWLAMSAALLLALLRSRRVRRLEPPEPGICRYRPETASVAEQLVDRGRAVLEGEEEGSDEDANDDAAKVTKAPAAPAALLPISPLAHLECVDPGRVAVAERDGQTVDLDLAGVGALVLVRSEEHTSELQSRE